MPATIPRATAARLLAVAFLLAAALPPAAAAERPPQGGGDVAVLLDRLNTVGSVLYIAAHPDDENTAFLAWLGRGRNLEVGYLSLTRGDGGQNLIGAEQGDLLGVIRTQELLAARAIDGARQFFSRAVDFGFSKSPDEALAIWGREEILADVVRVIRQFRPDVIVTRFPDDGRGGHGHHTASAILAFEAFTAAADPTRFPEQLAMGLAPWQARRVLWNRFSFGGDTRPPADAAELVEIDLGGYDPLVGRSFNETAALSRSQHRSQGFGVEERRGPSPNWFDPCAGDAPQGDLLSGIDLTWGRLEGGSEVGRLLARARAELDPRRPAAVLPLLVQARKTLAQVEDRHWRTVKGEELDRAIQAASGLWLEALAERPEATAGSEVGVTVTAINRSSFPLTLTAVELPFPAVTGPDRLPPSPLPLADNRPATLTAKLRLPGSLAPTQPYWLAEPAEPGRHRIGDPALLGRPDSPPVAAVILTIVADGVPLRFPVPVVHKSVDPVLGERRRPLQVVPAATLAFDRPLYVFTSAARDVTVKVRAARDGVSGQLSLSLPAGFQAEPATAPVALATAGAEASVRFTIRAPPGEARATLGAVLASGGERLDRARVDIVHEHIPPQTLFPPATATAVRVDLAAGGRRIGYVMGAGDRVADALAEAGYSVSVLDDETLASSDLSRFDAIVTGVRAYNTRPALARLQPRLLDYVASGGTMVVQYNVDRGLVVDPIGPYPLTLGRDRVTVEDAAMTPLQPADPLLAAPNRIGEPDFRGWVQERGLYFAAKWDERYRPVLASHDPGEPPLAGGLLVARHGKGVWIYTGHSWFRQLPAGVPGAFRIFANLLAAKGEGGTTR